MGKITYASLKLKTNTEVKTIKFQDSEIEVLQYLPIEDKYDLVHFALENAKEATGLYNPIRLDTFFHLYIIYMYTNITFTEKQKENEAKLYDTLYSNGLVHLVLENIPEIEYQFLQQSIEEYIKTDLEYNTTFAAIIKTIVDELPKRADQVNEILNNFNPEQFQAVLDFAKAANGGRDI